MRIGNYVNECYQVVEIDNLGCGICSPIDDTSSYIHLEYKDIKPIPLTEEWHNKFGIKKDGFGSFIYKLPRVNNIKIRVVFNGDYVFLRQGLGRSIDDDIVSIWNKDLTKRDMFVNEWQNLYHALTGKELV